MGLQRRVQGVLGHTIDLAHVADARFRARIEGAAAIPTPSLVVAPDGTGTHRALAAALAAAAAAAVVLLPAGTHYLDQGILLQQPVTLVGEGMAVTELVADEVDEYVLPYEGAGVFGLRDLAVCWAGDHTTGAEVVVIDGGEARIEPFRFTGANSADISQASRML